MSNIFISHSSQDAPLAREIAQALRDGNYASLFLDIDEQDGIKSFEDWEQVLYRKLRAARAVIAICTDHWLASKWCFAEIAIARALGKPVLPVVSMPLEDGGIEKLPAQLAVRQVIDLRTQTQRGLTRLAGALSELGLQPSLGNWDSKRCPYPGLIAYDESHASVFFGREPEVAHGIELLRRIRTSRMDRFVTVVGASGTGKSSLVRAGIIPIVRTIPDQPWSVVLVRPFRAVFAPIAELADALAVTFGGERSVYRDLIKNNADFAAVLRELREQSDHPDAIVLLVLDQFEECLSGEPELELFLQLISVRPETIRH